MLEKLLFSKVLSCSFQWLFKWCCCLIANCVQLFWTPWTVAFQAFMSLRFPKQENWRGLLFPFPGDSSDPGIESCLLHWHVDSLPSSHLESLFKCWGDLFFFHRKFQYIIKYNQGNKWRLHKKYFWKKLNSELLSKKVKCAFSNGIK